MILYNAKIFCPDNKFRSGYVIVEHGIIKDVVFSDNDTFGTTEVYDCKGCVLIPGLVDVHFHGCVGHDFCDADANSLLKIAKYQAQNGVCAICPASMTLPEDQLTYIFKNAQQYSDSSGADLVGINMEGPFISPNKVGAQNPKYVQKPSIEKFLRLQDAAGGLIKLVDVAPEVDGCLEFIKKASKYTTISIAHTCCDYETAKKAFEFGAKHLTHTFNAMPGIAHREPGPIIAAIEEGADAEIICDGMHIHYASVRFAFRALRSQNMVLISDSCEATGLEDGQYCLGGQKILKVGPKVVLKRDPDTIAASATNLFDCMKHAIFDCNIDTCQAISAATINPARSIGIDKYYGTIEKGKYANMVLVDNNFDIKRVFLHKDL